MVVEGLFWLAAFAIVFALISPQVARLPVSGPMVFVAFGLAFGEDGLGLLGLQVGGAETEVLAEATLAVLLFSDATRIDLPSLRREAQLPVRLLGIGLPLTLGLTTLITALAFTELSGAEAALIAAILTPTDAALGQAVVASPVVPTRIRQSLNVESGLNDGLVVPFVTLFLGLAAGEEAGDVGSFVGTALEEIAIGVGAGVVLAGLAGLAFDRVMVVDRMDIDPAIRQIAGLAIGVGAFAASDALEGNGFIAAFVAGLTLRGVMKARAAELVELSEDVGQLLSLLTFVVFGATLVGPALDDLTLTLAVAALLILTVGRMLPVAVSLLGSGVRPPTVVFLGWFGPRGLASMLFGLLLITESQVEAGADLFTVVTWVIIVSVVLHGATATWGANAYGNWYRTHPRRAEMPEGKAAAEPQPRWARRSMR